MTGWGWGLLLVGNDDLEKFVNSKCYSAPKVLNFEVITVENFRLIDCDMCVTGSKLSAISLITIKENSRETVTARKFYETKGEILDWEGFAACQARYYGLPKQLKGGKKRQIPWIGDCTMEVAA